MPVEAPEKETIVAALSLADLDAIRTHLAAWEGLADWAKDANGRRSAEVFVEDVRTLLAYVDSEGEGQ